MSGATRRPVSAGSGQPPAWTPNTFYKAGTPVQQYSALWVRLTDGTSAATFDPTNWTRLTERLDIALVPPGITAETDDRRSLSQGHTAVVGEFRGRPINLVPGNYSQVTCGTFTGVPAGMTNTFFALYPLAGGAPLAQSAESSALFNGKAAGSLVTVAMAFNCTAPGDYIIGYLVGGATTFPTLLGPPGGTSNNIAVANLLPRIMFTHSVAGLTAPPPNLTASAPGASRLPWFRYE